MYQRKTSIQLRKPALTTSSSYIPLLATDSIKSQFVRKHNLQRGSQAGPKISEVIEEIAKGREEKDVGFEVKETEHGTEITERSAHESDDEKMERKLLEKHVNKLPNFVGNDPESGEGDQCEDRLTVRRVSQNSERKVRKILYDPANSGSPSGSEKDKVTFEEVAPNGDVLFVGNVHLPLYQRLLVKVAKFVNPF